MEILTQHIQQGNGFRVHVNLLRRSGTTIIFMLSAHIPVEACGARMPEASSVVGDDAEYAFACMMISLSEGARA